jgi:hypothetical protein
MVLGSLGRIEVGAQSTPCGDWFFTAVAIVRLIDDLGRDPNRLEACIPEVMGQAQEQGRRFRREVAGLLRSDEHLRKLGVNDLDTRLLPVLPRLVHDAAGKEAVARMQADGVDDDERLECLAGLLEKPYDQGGICATDISTKALAMIVQRDIFIVDVTKYTYNTNGRINKFLHYSKEPPTGDLAYTSLLSGMRSADVHRALRLPKSIFHIDSIVLAYDESHSCATYPKYDIPDTWELQKSARDEAISNALSDRSQYFSSKCPTEGGAFLCSLETFLGTWV